MGWAPYRHSVALVAYVRRMQDSTQSNAACTARQRTALLLRWHGQCCVHYGNNAACTAKLTLLAVKKAAEPLLQRQC
jgi:hypothetical protein